MPSARHGGGRVDEPGRFHPQGAVFDCDGLLVDTGRCWATAYRVALSEAGADPEDPQITRHLDELNGASVGLAAEHLSGVLGRPISPDLLRRALIEAVEAETLQPMSGADELLSALAGEVRLAVASNGPAAVVDTVLHKTGLRHFFSHVVSAEDVGVPKPDPAVYLEACRRLSVPPARAVAFEDSAMGAEAARAAGIHLVAVPTAEGIDLEADVQASSLADPEVLAVFAAVLVR